METGGISGGDGGSSEGEKKKPQEGETKVKRIMKTASQLEVLEKTYASLFYFLTHSCLDVFFSCLRLVCCKFGHSCFFSGNVPVRSYAGGIIGAIGAF